SLSRFAQTARPAPEARPGRNRDSHSKGKLSPSRVLQVASYRSRPRTTFARHEIAYLAQGSGAMKRLCPTAVPVTAPVAAGRGQCWPRMASAQPDRQAECGNLQGNATFHVNLLAIGRRPPTTELQSRSDDSRCGGVPIGIQCVPR